MRVDHWLTAELPELADLQKASILRQLEDALTTLAPQHRHVTPPKVYDATQTITAAFALYWAGRFWAQGGRGAQA
jgi:hypothetical protein